MLYALINNTGIHRLEVAEKLQLADLQNRVGIEGEDAYIEYVRYQFTDPNIDLICDEEFLDKQLPLTCITRQSIALRGQVIAAASTEAGETIGLTEAQFQLVATNLTLVMPS
ncbi:MULTISPECIES: DUF3846 domain-containing protein [unclassified Microcoleus]|uniref:DUF3846 domain-containing protein n=1 Tax=unclassified Microcoleus TaxID=2642155 RepID=UPI002FD13037